VAYGPGRDGSEVILYMIEGGGHTWPGQDSMGPLFGKTALDLRANDLIWEFFRRHPMP
jgi:polyhydroxybutyrate depolymerase